MLGPSIANIAYTNSFVTIQLPRTHRNKTTYAGLDSIDVRSVIHTTANANCGHALAALDCLGNVFGAKTPKLGPYHRNTHITQSIHTCTRGSCTRDTEGSQTWATLHSIRNVLGRLITIACSSISSITHHSTLDMSLDIDRQRIAYRECAVLAGWVHIGS